MHTIAELNVQLIGESLVEKALWVFYTLQKKYKNNIQKALKKTSQILNIPLPTLQEITIIQECQKKKEFEKAQEEYELITGNAYRDSSSEKVVYLDDRN